MTPGEAILVLAEPADEPQIQLLRERLEGTTMMVGSSFTALRDVLPDATVLYNCAGSLTLFREVFRNSPRLRWVHSRSVGLERTWFPELAQSSVVLTNGSGVFSAALGEFTVGAILYFAKDFRRMVSNQAHGKWEQFDVERVEGKTVGIVGYGDIGRAIASRARALGMRVLGLKRHAAQQTADFAERVFSVAQLLEMVALSDYVAVAAPLTAETRGMIDRYVLAAMKPTSVIINVGRGPVIDETALVQVLTEKRIRGAALDVFDEEPLPNEHPFYHMENVLLSPHCADHTPDWLDNAALFFVDQFERYMRGETLLNVVDKALGY
jgi:phosphoglycerate dehydrogenase-like enzyme